MKRKNKIALIVFSISLFIITCFSYGCYYVLGISMPGYRILSPFQGRVVDADTGEPIGGAAVLAVYKSSDMSVAGTITRTVDAQETLTDKKGEFKIPESKFWVKEDAGRPMARLIIFKPRYGAFPEHPRSKALKENKSRPSADKYIVYELPKLKTREERRSNLPLRPDIPYAKMKNFVRLINEERISLGFSPLTIPK